jgi:hypothetical protein
LLLAALVIAPFVLIILWECGHYARFGHFFRYGYHVDLVLDHSDIAVPGVNTFYCLRVTNYTLRSLQFEGIQLPRELRMRKSSITLKLRNGTSRPTHGSRFTIPQK